MKRLIVPLVARILIAVFLCVVISLVMAAFAPQFTNDMALGQLENDDMSWATRELWNKLQGAVDWIKVGICAFCTIDCGKVIYTHIKNRKEELN